MIIATWFSLVLGFFICRWTEHDGIIAFRVHVDLSRKSLSREQN